MKAFLIKYISISWALLFFCDAVQAQVLSRLVPDYVVIQHAGSIGYVSAGAGYEIFKNGRGSLEFEYGIVPENKGGPLHILSSKFIYRPILIAVNSKVEIFPLNPGVFLSYHLDKQFDIAFDKEQYIKSYYGWSTAVRGYLSVSNEIRLNTGKHVKWISIYSEFNASDLYLASLFYKNNSKWLSATDIIKLGIGIKLGF